MDRTVVRLQFEATPKAEGRRQPTRRCLQGCSRLRSSGKDVPPSCEKGLLPFYKKGSPTRLPLLFCAEMVVTNALGISPKYISCLSLALRPKHLLGGFLQFRLKIRMGDTDQRFGPLTLRFALEIDDAELRHHIVRILPWGGKRTPEL